MKWCWCDLKCFFLYYSSMMSFIMVIVFSVGVVGGQEVNVLLMGMEAAEQKGKTNTPLIRVNYTACVGTLSMIGYTTLVQCGTPRTIGRHNTFVSAAGTLGNGRWLARYSQVSVTDH